MKKLRIKDTTRGFTLIELLVVIAIIGVLAGVVMASLNVARGKGNTAGVRTTLAQMRTQSNLYLNASGNFGTIGGCATAGSIFVADTKFVDLLAKVQSITGSAPTCLNTVNSWAVTTPIKPDGSTTTHLCVDFSGIIKSYTSAPTITAGATCP